MIAYLFKTFNKCWNCTNVTRRHLNRQFWMCICSIFQQDHSKLLKYSLWNCPHNQALIPDKCVGHHPTIISSLWHMRNAAYKWHRQEHLILKCVCVYVCVCVCMCNILITFISAYIHVHANNRGRVNSTDILLVIHIALHVNFLHYLSFQYFLPRENQVWLNLKV